MKKIIIASPNSASESLSACINLNSDHSCFQITNLDFRNLIRKKYKNKKIKKIISLLNYYLNRNDPSMINYSSLRNYSPAPDYPKLSYYHNDIASFNGRTSFILEHLTKEKKIAKQHFPPTLENKIYFKDWRKVILLRKPEEVLNKYVKRDNDILISNEEYKSKLLKEVYNWHDGWNNCDNSLIIYKDDLVNNVYETLKKIGEYTGINFKIGKDYILPKIL
tara:strand:- start:2238 stop:2900 length:663 start_codon:yes stop_codon:yes gene_type:complete